MYICFSSIYCTVCISSESTEIKNRANIKILLDWDIWKCGRKCGRNVLNSKQASQHLLYGVEEEEKYTFAIPTRYGIDQSGYCVVLFRSAKKTINIMEKLVCRAHAWDYTSALYRNILKVLHVYISTDNRNLFFFYTF